MSEKTAPSLTAVFDSTGAPTCGEESVRNETSSLFDGLKNGLKALDEVVVTSRRRVEMGERVHLEGLERGFSDVCSRIRTLDADLARVFRQPLLKVVSDLDELKDALIRQKEQANFSAGGASVDMFSRRSRAVGAYGRVQDGGGATVGDAEDGGESK